MIHLISSVILVTGAAGFIGSFLCRRIIQDIPDAKIVGENPIIILDAKPAKYNSNGTLSLRLLYNNNIDIPVHIKNTIEKISGVA